MEKHNLIIVITIVLGCFVSFQALQLEESVDDEIGAPWDIPIPLWEGPWNKVPDGYRANLTLRGRLSHAGFPYIAETKYYGDVISIGIGFKDMVTLELFDTAGYVTAVFYLYLEEFRAGECVWAGMISVPMCGNLKVGSVEIADLYEAEFIEVEGYAFDVVAVDKKRYHLLRVNETRVLAHVSEELAVHIGRHFLDGKGHTTGMVLSSKLEEKEPNFYWDRLVKWERPDIRGPRFCWVIRFEQAKRPGHFFEVWIDAIEYLVVGGGQCR